MREAAGVVAIVTAHQADVTLVLEREDAPPIRFLFVDPAVRVEGAGYFGGMHEGGDLGHERKV